jgi:hypothetical protein
MPIKRAQKGSNLAASHAEHERLSPSFGLLAPVIRHPRASAQGMCSSIELRGVTSGRAAEDDASRSPRHLFSFRERSVHGASQSESEVTVEIGEHLPPTTPLMVSALLFSSVASVIHHRAIPAATLALPRLALTFEIRGAEEASLLKTVERRLCERLTEALLRREARGNGTAAVPLPLRSDGWFDQP